MDKELYDALLKLKESIENDSRVLALNEVDARLSSNEEVMKLSYKKDMAVIEYEDAINHFGQTHEITLKAQKKLYEAKKELDSHPLVKEYNQKYQEVRLMYNHINEELFGRFISKNRCA